MKRFNRSINIDRVVQSRRIVGSSALELILPLEGLAAALVRQTGTDRVEPGDRVQSFTRDRSMARYIQLFDRLVAGAARSAPAFAGPQKI